MSAIYGKPQQVSHSISQNKYEYYNVKCYIKVSMASWVKVRLEFSTLEIISTLNCSFKSKSVIEENMNMFCKQTFKWLNYTEQKKSDCVIFQKIY